ncbi:MAG: hypothetical protein IKE85_06055 [Mogibacterium sp.]|nr:hypothetical protein [Mogibacterium sp.]
MTLEEIKKLMPVFERWKLNITLIYGDRYAELYCTWERFRDHLQVLEVMEKDKKKYSVEDLIPECIKAEIRENATKTARKQHEIF